MPLVLLPYCGLVIAVLLRIREYWGCPINRFALIWVAIVVILVSSSGTQLPHYILYSTGPLFMLYARILPTLVSRLWALPGLFVPLSVLGFGLFHQLLPEPNHLRDQEQLIMLFQVITEWRIVLVATSLGLLLLSLIVLLLPEWQLGQRLITLGCVQLACIAFIVLPIISEARQQPLKDAALMAREANADVVSQGVRMPSFSFYRGAITREQAPTKGQWVLISATLFQELKALDAAFKIKASGPGWRLIAPHEPSKI
ncbi:MAG TPA: hypothetical protein DCQ47_04620 [Gammaproteobacteria bacterium]|nr:hypothetical protein [Gammaproteobacteria bacterium]